MADKYLAFPATSLASHLGFLETGAIAGSRGLPWWSRLTIATSRHSEIAVHFARVTTNCTQTLRVRYADLAPIAHHRTLRPSG